MNGISTHGRYCRQHADRHPVRPRLLEERTAPHRRPWPDSSLLQALVDQAKREDPDFALTVGNVLALHERGVLPFGEAVNRIVFKHALAMDEKYQQVTGQLAEAGLESPRYCTDADFKVVVDKIMARRRIREERLEEDL